MRRDLAKIPGVRAIPQTRQGLVRGGGQPLQVVLQGPDYAQLVQWRDRMLARMEQNPGLYGVDADYKETRPQLHVIVDQAKAADLGVTEQAIGDDAAGDARFAAASPPSCARARNTTCVLQAARRRARDTDRPAAISTCAAAAARWCRWRAWSSCSERAEAGSLGRFNRLRAITLSARPGAGLHAGRGDRLGAHAPARDELPATAQLDFSGQSREYLQSGSAVLFTFGMALLIVFLVLAAQFESFLHPLVIMLTVPLAVLGALLGLCAVRQVAQPLQPDRHRDAGRAGGEERHPDRRVRQPAPRRRA